MIVILALTLALSLPQATYAGSLIGLWVEEGGSPRARIARCPESPTATLCASIVGSGETVLTGLTPDGQGRWRGRYVADGLNLGATVRMTRPDVVAMTACRLVLCQSVTYRRAR